MNRLKRIKKEYAYHTSDVFCIAKYDYKWLIKVADATESALELIDRQSPDDYLIVQATRILEKALEEPNE